MRGCLLRTKEVVGLNQTPTAESASLVSASIRDTHRRGKHTDVENTPLSGICISDVICVKNKKQKKKM